MQRENEVQHVFLVGAKSLGAYGGYETFVYKLTEYHQNKKNIKYHVACKANGDGCMDETKVEGVTRINDHEFEFHNAHCFKIDIPQIGAAQAIYYDVAALNACCKYIKEHKIKNPIVYIMACRIGPFAAHFYKEIHKLGGTVYLNPDGECEIIWTTREKPDFMAMFEQPTLKDTIQVLMEVQPLVAEDAEMSALVQQTIPKMQQLNEQQFKGLELEWHRPEEAEGENVK